MKRVIISMLLLGGFTALSTMEASAVVCARGVYRAGCVATGGAVVATGVVVRHPCRRAEERGRYPPLKVYGPTAHVDNSRSIGQ